MTNVNRHWYVGLIGLVLVMSGPLLQPEASAATLRNGDATAHMVKIVRRGKADEEVTVAPGAVRKELCQDGCILRLTGDGNNDYKLEGTERVSIEGGLVYYDGPVIRDPASPAKPE